MSSSHSTLYIDPSYDSKNFRSEFRFPKQNGVYLPDMRLLNVGVEKTNTGASSYNILCGSYGVIDSIQIYSGSQLIDQVLHFSEWIAVKALLNSNNENQSVHRPLSRNKLGWVSASKIDSSGFPEHDVLQTNKIPNEFNSVYGSDASAQEKPQNGGWLDLRKVFGFLKSSTYVPMNVYPDLRVVLNYKNSAKQLDMVADRAGTYKTLEPLLVCEYEADPNVADALMRSYKGVAFTSVEHDQLQYVASTPATNATEAQTASYITKAFNDKFISKLLIVNTPADSSTWVSGTDNTSMANQGSVSQLDWDIQARVNGVNWFPQVAYTGKNRRLGMMVDAWGSMNLAYGQNLCSVADGAGSVFVADAEDTMGQVDYTGFRIEEVVKELKLTLARTAVGNNASAGDNEALRQALHLNCFGLSRKRCVPTSNGILVQYV